MPTFNTQKFIEGAKQRGFSDTQISSFLEGKGIDPAAPKQAIQPKGKINFLQRLALSFGDEESKIKSRQMETQAGLRGKFDVGDIADIAGGSLPFVGGVLGAGGGTLVGTPVGGALGAGIGTTAGESVKRAIGQILGVRRSKGPVSEAVGAVGSGVATGLTVGALGLVGRGIKAVTPKIGGGTGTLLFGKQQKELIGKSFSQAEQLKKFQTGELSTQKLAEITAKATEKVKLSSKAKFAAAESKLKEIPVDKSVLKETIPNQVKEFFGLTAKQKISLKTTNLDTGELRIVNNALNLLKSRAGKKDLNTKDLLLARRQIDKLYKGTEGNKTADAVLTEIRSVLNGLINAKDPAFAKATAKASSDIDFLKQLGIDVLGKKTRKASVEATAKKLSTLISKIDDPQQFEATKQLIQELEKRSGVKITPLLESAATFKQLQQLPLKSQGAISQPLGTLQNLLVRALTAIGQKTGSVQKPNLPPNLGTKINTGVVNLINQ